MKRYWLIYDGTGSGGTGWYLVVLRQCNSVLFSMKWHWVAVGLMCLYKIKKSEILSGVTIEGQRRTKKER